MGYSKLVAYTIPAAGTIANLLTGLPMEYFGGAAKLTVYGAQDTGGDTAELKRFTGSEAGQIDIDTSTLAVAGAAGQLSTSDHFLAQLAIPGGSRLVLTIVGTAAHVGRLLFVVE